MPVSTQPNYANSNSARPRGRVSAANTTNAIGISSSAQHSWQTLVLLEQPQLGPVHGGDKPTYVRFDNPHNATPSPWSLAQWREDFGWHRKLVDIVPSKKTSKVLRITASALDSRGPQAVATGSPTFPAKVPQPAVPQPAVPQPAVTQPAVTQPAVAHANLNHMLAEVAHDIRSPIAVAQQIISSLSQRAQPLSQWTSEQTELLHEAQLRLTQANRWAEGILVQHSLDHGQPVSVRRRFYPQQWLRSVQPLLNSLAKQRGVRLLWIGWDRSLPRLYSDANQLSRVLLNLVDNAIQASRPGNEVRVHVAWQTPVTQRMIVTIEDDGRGLSRELMQQVNAPHNPSSDALQSNSGIGLGLTTAKTLVHALGGTLRAQHPSDGGTRFSLMLPVDNYHSLVHSWLQQNSSQSRLSANSPQQQITIHALRSAQGVTSASMWNEIDLQLQQAASGDDLVYRVARDRWLWLSKQATRGSAAVPTAMSAALRKLRERDNAWNLALDCRQQQVFAWQSPATQSSIPGGSRAVASGHSCVMRLTSIIAERIAELIGEHVPPIDDLQFSENPIVVRPNAGGQVRLIRSDRAHWDRPAPAQMPASAKPAPAATASIAETPCDSFSGTLAELAQQWHSRQVRLDQIQSAIQPPRL